MRLSWLLCERKFEYEINIEIKYKHSVDLHLNVSNLLAYSDHSIYYTYHGAALTNASVYGLINVRIIPSRITPAVRGYLLRMGA